MPLSHPVSALLDDFHAARTVRAWSLIVTLYGDAIVPRGGSLWLGSLTEIMALFRIDAGHVRTAMSRLTSDGLLARTRSGRNSYYRLSAQAEASFAAATRRIYFANDTAFDGRLRLALLGSGVDDRSAVRPALRAAGFMPLSPSAYVSVADAPADIRALPGVFFLRAEVGETAALASEAWNLTPLAAAYEAFIARFTPAAHALAKGAPEPADALVARTLLIHEFRRIVLRDPALPSAMLPEAWPAAPARRLAADLYRRLVPPAERWLDAHAVTETGPLSAPDAAFSKRFATKI